MREATGSRGARPASKFTIALAQTFAWALAENADFGMAPMMAASPMTWMPGTRRDSKPSSPPFLRHAAIERELPKVIEHGGDRQFADDVGQFDHLRAADPELQMPAERLDAFHDGFDHLQVRRAAEVGHEVETRAAHADIV